MTRILPVWRRWRFRLRHPFTWRTLEAGRFDAIVRQHYMPIITRELFEPSPLMKEMERRRR